MSSSKSQSPKPSLIYGSPCAACKFLRRKCVPDCIFAPYFPADQPRKFDVVHRIYGASNISKILNLLSHDQRDEAVNSLVYEAESRLKDPVCGCVGFISILEARLKELQAQLFVAQRELSTYTMLSNTQAGCVPILPPLHMPDVGSSSSSSMPRSWRGDKYLFQQVFMPQQMTIDASQHGTNQVIKNTLCFDSVQPHGVSNVCQSFDNQQTTTVGATTIDDNAGVAVAADQHL